MNSKERVLATLAGKKTDKIPVHHQQFSGHAASVILGRRALVGGAFLQWQEINALWQGHGAHEEFKKKSREDAVAVAMACGHDVLRLSYWSWPESEKPVKKIDDYTFLFGDPKMDWYTLTYLPDVELFSRREGHGSHEGSHIVPEPEITEQSLTEQVLAEEAKGVRPTGQPHACYKKLYDSYPDYILKLASNTVYINVTSSQSMMAAAMWPDLYRRLLFAKAAQIKAEIISLAAAGMQVNFAGMDFCSNQGPMLSPQMLRDIVIPPLKLIVDECHRRGITHFYSSDGNFWSVADDFFITAGIDGWCEVDQSAGMDLRRLRKQYPRQSFMGNIRVQLLARGGKEDVRREVLECFEAAHELGGIIVGASNMIMPDTPPENIMTMLKTIEEVRKK